MKSIFYPIASFLILIEGSNDKISPAQKSTASENDILVDGNSRIAAR